MPFLNASPEKAQRHCEPWEYPKHRSEAFSALQNGCTQYFHQLSARSHFLDTRLAEKMRKTSRLLQVLSSARCLRGVSHTNGARSSSTFVNASVGSDKFLDKYKRLQSFAKEKFEIKEIIKPTQVFAENQTDFSNIKVYGFDYDYTLAEYSNDIETFIYKTGLDILIGKYKYPQELLRREYDPNYFIRGLHYDIKRSLIMKIDDRHRVQLDTVYKGFRKVEEDEVIKEFELEHIPKKVMDESCYRGSGNLQQLTDTFSLPEMMLLANVVDYFTERNYPYDPWSVFEAVENAVREVHTSGHLYEELRRNVDKYLEKEKLIPLIDKLKRDGKRLFILTNSGYPSLDVGMRHMLGEDWREAFELVIVGARKPEFFEESRRPFKTLLLKSHNFPVLWDRFDEPVSWDRIDELQSGEVYCGGCCSELMRLKDWKFREVIYFGDQIYADLESPNQSKGWYTGAIIHELEREIDIMNKHEFAREVVWAQVLEALIEKVQDRGDAEAQELRSTWLKERGKAKKSTREGLQPALRVRFPVFTSRQLLFGNTAARR